MGSKSYKKGMQDASAAFEEKFRKQGQTVQKVTFEIKTGMKKLSDGQEQLIDIAEDHDKRLTVREKKELYGLGTRTDIASFDETVKDLIAGILFTMANENEEVNDQQKEYLLSVLHYIDVANPPTNIKISCVENIENITVQKAILQLVFEFHFLQNNDFSFLDDFDGVLSYFSINKKSIEEIKEYASSIYHNVGPKGLAEKYGYRDIEEYDNIKPQQEELTVDEPVVIVNKTWKIQEISKKCADLVNINAYTETDNYLVYYHLSNFYKVHKITGERTLVKENADVGTYEINNRFKAVGDILYYLKKNGHDFIEFNLETLQEKEYSLYSSLNNEITGFQIHGTTIFFSMYDHYIRKFFGDLFSYNLQTGVIGAVNLDVYEDKHQLFVGNWLLKGNSIWFTTVDDINQYVYPTDRKNVLNKDYLYCYDLTSKTVKKVCKYRSIGERNKILDELSHNMREYNGMQIFIPASSSIYLGDSFIVVIDINTPEPKPEYINIPVNGTNAELFYSNESLFIAEKRSGLPIYKFDIDTMTRTQLGSDCGKTSVSKSSLFKSSEIEYIIWNDVQVVGNWLYYKSGEPLGEGCNIICVDMDKPMQMSKIVLQ